MNDISNYRNKIGVAAFALMIILAIGTVGYHFLDPHMSFFDSFYMTVITITTVGFGEINDLDPGTRPFTIFLIFTGFGLISYVLISISQIVVEGEFQRMMGRRKLNREIAALEDHIVICGYGRIGEIIAYYFKKWDYPFVVVEKSDERIEDIKNAGHLFVQGDATSDDILETAGIKKASKLIAATNSDAQNVFIVLTAKELNPNLLIHSRAYAEEAEKRLRRAGADNVLFPDTIGGYRMAVGLIRPTFMNFMDVVTRSYEEGEIAVDELSVGGECTLVDKTLMEARIRQNYNLIIIAIKRVGGEFRFNPDKDTVIMKGDILLAIGLRKDLREFEKNMRLIGDMSE
jgi:voltage-gated potassium channel